MGMIRILMVRGDGDPKPAVNDGAELVEELVRERCGTFRVRFRHPEDLTLLDKMGNHSFTCVDVEAVEGPKSAALEVLVHVYQAAAPFDGGFTLRWGEALAKVSTPLGAGLLPDVAPGQVRSSMYGTRATLDRTSAYPKLLAGSVDDTVQVDKDGKLIFFEGPDARWLHERGEDVASLRALVEAVDAASEKHWGPEFSPTGGKNDPASRRWLDRREKVVNWLSARADEKGSEDLDLISALADAHDCVGGANSTFWQANLSAVARAIVDHARELEARVAELEDGGGSKDAGEGDVEDVPLGGLSHEDAHFVLSGIRTAADALDAASAWPDDARRWASYLRKLLGAGKR